MNIVLLCATQRGLQFFNTLTELAPNDHITVFTFPEDQGEPRFVDDIQTAAAAAGATFFQARDVYEVDIRDFWQREPVDLLFAVSWRFMVPRAAFAVPRLGSYVFHDSLLPSYRGFSPTVWAIANGEDHTGVTLFEMSDEVDSGDIVDQERVAIGGNDTIREALERTTLTYLRLLRRNLDSLKAGTSRPYPQDQSRATYWPKRKPEDNVIHWEHQTSQIYNLVRAVTHPYPGARTTIDGHQVTIWAAQRAGDSTGSDGLAPGTIALIRPGTGVEVATGDGMVLITSVQIDDGMLQTADQVLTQGGILGR